MSKIETMTPQEISVLRAHLSLMGNARSGDFLLKHIIRDVSIDMPQILTKLFGKNGYTGIPLVYPISTKGFVIGELVNSDMLYHRLAAHLDALESMKLPSIESLYRASLMNNRLNQTYPIMDNASELILDVLQSSAYVLSGFNLECACAYIKIYLANVCHESDLGWLFDRSSAGELLGVEKTKSIRYNILYKPFVVPDIVVSESPYLSDLDFSMVTLDLERQDAVKTFVHFQTIYYNAKPNHTQEMQCNFTNAYLVLLEKYHDDADRANEAVCNYQDNAGQEVQSGT